jgi:hypothetical protein
VRFRSVTLDQLRIEDERSYRHIGLYEELKRALVRDRVPFHVPAPGARPGWDRVLFLNLTFWSPDAPADVLEDDTIPADVVMHSAWHHLTRRALVAAGSSASLSPESLFLGESIASAFDLYLVGRLMGHSPNAIFLETQVPAMAEVAEQRGMAEETFERMLEEVAAEPERAFEDLRELLFDASTTLVRASSVDAAAEALERFDAHRFGALLHHYELSTWILYARAYARDVGTPDARAMEIDAALRAAPVALEWLEKTWVYAMSGGPEADSREGSA